MPEPALNDYGLVIFGYEEGKNMDLNLEEPLPDLLDLLLLNLLLPRPPPSLRLSKRFGRCITFRSGSWDRLLVQIYANLTILEREVQLAPALCVWRSNLDRVLHGYSNTAGQCYVEERCLGTRWPISDDKAPRLSSDY
jgi:hypothetical protein